MNDGIRKIHEASVAAHHLLQARDGVGLMDNTKRCAVCDDELTIAATIARGKTGRWITWPPVRHQDGRVGHTECFIREGTVTWMGRTGPEFADELDQNGGPTPEMGGWFTAIRDPEPVTRLEGGEHVDE